MAFATTLDGTIVYANARYLAACRAAPHRVVAVSYTHLTLPTICSV